MSTPTDEIKNLRLALDYAIKEADGWHDECRGGPLESIQMDAARQLLAFSVETGPVTQAPVITEHQAHAMGAKGAPATEYERLLFEAWMRGHCWKITGDWNGKSYTTQAELAVGFIDYHAMATRQIWSAFRDRGALSQLAAAG